MAHVNYMSAVAGLSEMHVLETESPARLDARRKVAARRSSSKGPKRIGTSLLLS